VKVTIKKVFYFTVKTLVVGHFQI